MQNLYRNMIIQFCKNRSRIDKIMQLWMFCPHARHNDTLEYFTVMRLIKNTQVLQTFLGTNEMNDSFVWKYNSRTKPGLGETLSLVHHHHHHILFPS